MLLQYNIIVHTHVFGCCLLLEQGSQPACKEPYMDDIDAGHITSSRWVGLRGDAFNLKYAGVGGVFCGNLTVLRYVRRIERAKWQISHMPDMFEIKTERIL